MSVYFNNQFLQNENALVHISDLSLQRGYGVFDFLRAVNGVPLYIDDHLNRFFASAENMHLPIIQTKTTLKEIILSLVQQNDLPIAGVRMMLTGGYSKDGYAIAEPNLIITCNTIAAPVSENIAQPISIITYNHQRELPHIKSINYLMAVWLLPMLQKHNAADVLYVNNDVVTECPRSNIFIATNKETLVTPKHNILAGITRKNVIAIANTMMAVEERDITLEELYNAAEVFVTSTTKKVMPVGIVNEKLIANGNTGNYTATLYKKILELEQSLLK